MSIVICILKHKLRYLQYFLYVIGTFCVEFTIFCYVLISDVDLQDLTFWYMILLVHAQNYPYVRYQ